MIAQYLWLDIFSTKLKYFSKKLYLMVHVKNKINLLYVLNFKKGSTCPFPYMDFQCNKYSKWNCLHWVYWEYNKCSVTRPFKDPVLFDLVKNYQVHAYSRTCWEYNKNECRFSYGWYFTEKTIIAKPFDSKLSNDEKEDVLTLIWVDFVGVCFKVGEVKLPHSPSKTR